MRHTQPLTPDEAAIDLALRKKHLSHAEIDRALSKHRLCVYEKTRAGEAPEFVRFVRLEKRI